MPTLLIDKGGLVAQIIKRYAERLLGMTTIQLLAEFKKVEPFWKATITKGDCKLED